MSVVKSAILKHLQADASITALVGTRIYPGEVAPEGVAFPLILVTAQKAPKAERVFQGIAFEESLYLVKAIDKDSSPKTASEINQAVRASLESVTLTITGYRCEACLWMADVDYSTLESSVNYQHQGGFFYVMAEAN